MTYLFVWVQSLKGPMPELWPEILRDMHGKEIPTLKKYEMTETDRLRSFDELMVKYPAPVVEKTST